MPNAKGFHHTSLFRTEIRREKERNGGETGFTVEADDEQRIALALGVAVVHI